MSFILSSMVINKELLEIYNENVNKYEKEDNPEEKDWHWISHEAVNCL